MPRVIAALIRHGDYQQLPDTPSAHQPFPLTEQGLAQAGELAAILTDFCQQQQCQINPHIASSRLLRAWQTANALSTKLNLPNSVIKEYDELAERCLGSAANLSVQQIAEVIRLDPRYTDLPANWKSDSAFCLPFQGAESLLDAGKRLRYFLHAEMQYLLQHSQSDQLKIFIGHGAAFRHAAYYLRILQYAQIAQLSMYHCQPIFIEYKQHDQWQHIGGAWKVRHAQSQFTD